MITRSNRLVLLLSVATWTACATHSAPPPAEKAQIAVNEFLAKLSVPQGRMTPLQDLNDPSVSEVFPASRFFLLRFRQYPVARIPAEPLGFNNLFMVSDDLKVKLITNSEALLEAFGAAAAASPQKVALAWASLAKELVDDGMYHLETQPDQMKVQAEGGTKTVAIPVEPAPRGGNRGKLTFSLTFDASGRLVGQHSDDGLVRGPRPVCQSMVLNDPDPEVRAAAERVLLLMGCDALSYLHERLEVVEPALAGKIQSVIDKIEASN